MLEYQAIVERIARGRHRHVLDWGCGFGQITRMLKDADVPVTAFDYRPGVERDGSYPLERFPSLEAELSSDPRRLPFDDSSFDAVLSLGVLEHVEDPDASLDEIHRVLEPGGTFYVYKLPNRGSYLEWIARRAGLYYHGALPNDRVYGRRSAHALLARHGFEIVEFRRMNVLPLTLTGAFAERFAAGVWRANVALGRLPALNLAATNLEFIARRP
jgi:ubiquinone/menaquinone biosynthesis C-methylase UbiE